MTASGVAGSPQHDAAPSGLAAVLLAALAEEEGGAASVPRLGKRLQLGASVVMRELAMMGSARIGNHAGPGWVEVAHDGERWMARLTAEGARALQAPGGVAPESPHGPSEATA